MFNDPQDQVKRELLESCRIIAVVGLNDDPDSPSYYVADYLQNQGYQIVPVNPYMKEVLGEKAYPDLASVPYKIDVVDVFRRSEAVHEVVQSAQSLGIPAVWVQPGIKCSQETMQFVQKHHMLLIKDA